MTRELEDLATGLSGETPAETIAAHEHAQAASTPAMAAAPREAPAPAPTRLGAAGDEALFKSMEADAQERAERRKANERLARGEKEAGNAAYAQGDMARALLHYSAALKHAPHLMALHTNKAQALIKLGRYADAVAECDEVLRVEGFASTAIWNKARYRRACALLQLGEHARARADVDALLAAEPSNGEAAALAEAIARAAARAEADACSRLAPDALASELHGVAALCAEASAAGERRLDAKLGPRLAGLCARLTGSLDGASDGVRAALRTTLLPALSGLLKARLCLRPLALLSEGDGASLDGVAAALLLCDCVAASDAFAAECLAGDGELCAALAGVLAPACSLADGPQRRLLVSALGLLGDLERGAPQVACALGSLTPADACAVAHALLSHAAPLVAATAVAWLRAAFGGAGSGVRGAGALRVRLALMGDAAFWNDLAALVAGVADAATQQCASELMLKASALGDGLRRVPFDAVVARLARADLAPAGPLAHTVLFNFAREPASRAAIAACGIVQAELVPQVLAAARLDTLGAATLGLLTRLACEAAVCEQLHASEEACARRLIELMLAADWAAAPPCAEYAVRLLAELSRDEATRRVLVKARLHVALARPLASVATARLQTSGTLAAAALALADCASNLKVAAVLGAALPGLVALMDHADGVVARNAAIACARIAKHAANLVRLRELHGVERMHTVIGRGA